MDLKKEEKTQRAINKLQGFIQCAGYSKCRDSDVFCAHRVQHLAEKDIHCKSSTCWVIGEKTECV
jgi:hypothetical protein